LRHTFLVVKVKQEAKLSLG